MQMTTNEFTAVGFYVTGYSLSESAENSNVEVTRLNNILHTLNIPRHTRNKLSENARNNLKRDYDLGMKIVDLEKKYDITSTTIYRYIRGKNPIVNTEKTITIKTFVTRSGKIMKRYYQDGRIIQKSELPTE